MIRVPADLLSKDLVIQIKPDGEVLNKRYVFNIERLNYDGVTYLPIGDRPFKEYSLNLKNGNDKLYEFWHKKIRGIDPDGTLFEMDSGRKLPYDADVEIKKEYYLLKRGSVYKPKAGIQVREIAQKKFPCEVPWKLYVVSASEFNEDAAKFYLDYHCRLTDYPVSLRPVWPLFKENNCTVKHNQDTMYMLAKGNIAAVRSFPDSKISRLYGAPTNLRVYEVMCGDRQQLISAGRTQVLQYTYFWKENLAQEGEAPEITVTDISGSEVDQGETNTLPRNKILLFKSVFDGEIVISYDSRIVDKRKIFADKPLEIDGLSYGISVQAIIGLDVVWQIEFKKQQTVITNDEAEILKHINNTFGVSIPAPHSLRNILSGMSRYPQVCKWIRKCIKEGKVNEQSYRRLQDIYRNISTKTGR